MLDLYGFTLEALASRLVDAGFKKFNATQVFEWVYQKKVASFAEMTNLSKDLRAHLESAYSFAPLSVKREQTATDGTRKFLFLLDDCLAVETVLMMQDYGMSVCVSSQVGCSMGCSFCASGLQAKVRDLTPAELVNQVASVERYAGITVTHVVVMGTGEPFDNYDNVVEFIRIVNHPKGLAIGQRHITVSTCGIVPKILEYAEEPIRSNLAISLHAPNDELRSRIMKINRAYPLKDVIAACAAYFEKTGRRVTFEYILLSGVNDAVEQADELSDLIRGLNAYVNLIPYNHVREFRYARTDMERAMRFYDRLAKRGINAVLRKEQGGDIDAACGQLRMKADQCER
ncbi:MAG: 23S rRNA (adenine(2503)-C(2))-methyltransferase RlmN [Candidatus Izemoplasmatales bacterium]